MTTPTHTPDKPSTAAVEALPDKVTTDELAYLWSFHPRTLQRWRKAGTGPPWFRVGRRVYYDHAQLAQYLDAHTVPGWPPAGDAHRRRLHPVDRVNDDR